MRKTLVLGTALALASSLVVAQGYGQGYGPGYGQGRGMMGNGPQGGGMMGGGMMGYGYGQQGGGVFAGINLTEEQRQKVLSVQEEHRQKNWAAMGEVRAEQYKLRSLYGADKVDADKVTEQQKKVDELRRQMLKSRVEAHNQMVAILTPEQRKELRARAPWWPMGDDE
jgi:Spy/CpxP family protein refolding chaperone